MVQQGTPPSVPALLESFDESAAGGANRSASNNTVVQQGNAEIASIVYQRAAQLHSNAIRQAAEFGLAGLVGTLLGLVLLALVSRSISRPLARLAHQADELASVYLPATLNAMLTNETGSIPEGLPITVSGQDEVSEVARALDAVQKTAIELGAGQVVLRRNLSDAFVNLGRRTQRRTPTRWKSSFAWTTWPPACDATPSRCSSWPGAGLPANGPRPCRPWTWLGPPRPKWRTTSACASTTSTRP
jgi:HAMP domain-containing protein